MTLLGDRLEAHMCKQLSQSRYGVVLSQDSNQRPVNRKSNVLPIAQPHHHITYIITEFLHFKEFTLFEVILNRLKCTLFCQRYWR